MIKKIGSPRVSAGIIVEEALPSRAPSLPRLSPHSERQMAAEGARPAHVGGAMCSPIVDSLKASFAKDVARQYGSGTQTSGTPG